MRINKLQLLILTLFLTSLSAFQSKNLTANLPTETDPPFYQYLNNAWVDSVLKSMTVDEKIGQLFMIAAYSNKDKSHTDNIAYTIKKYHVGGLIFFQGGPVRQSLLTNYYQSITKTPLLIAGDWEWGLSMRLDSTIAYPRQMMLGAIQDNELIYEMGEEIASQCKRIGAQINFAPVIDINNNPKNPVIGSRSFGENKYNVALKGENYMRGMQNNGILATGKHFPGHGDTDTDSHKALPVINHSKERLDTLELYPFKQLFKAGLGGVMVAHIHIPSLDNQKNIATTLSHKVSTNLLKNELGFKGIAFTDALNMNGVSNYFEPGEVDLKALMAGNDILLYPKSVALGVAKIKEAIENKTLSMEVLDQKVRKILAVKYWTGLNKKQIVDITNITKDLNNEKALNLNQKLIENAITVVKNDKGFIPFIGLDTLKIASIVIGEQKENEFQKTLKLYANVKTFQINKNISQDVWNHTLAKLKDYNVIIVSFHKPSDSPSGNYGISNTSISQISELSKTKNVIIDVFANPYVLSKFGNLNNFKSVIVSYNDWDLTQKISAQIIFGGIPAKGKLPISINDNFKFGTGIIFDKPIRLKYTTPYDAGMNEEKLNKIDSIAINSIRERAFPGCQILAAKNGKVFYNKAFGSTTYENNNGVETSYLYDIASVTKIVASTISLMKLYDKKKINTNNYLGFYLPYLKGSNKDSLLILDVLTHQSKLQPWIPFYTLTLKNEETKKLYYSKFAQPNKNTLLADSMFVLNSYKDSIYNIITKSPLLPQKEYKYSDLGYYYMHQIIEKEANTKLEEFVQQEFYKPIGAYTMGYNPLNKFPKNEIVPTEYDVSFRKQVIQGYVHDMGAAMLGGIAGHAGIFSNSNDLAKIMQMLLNYGEYGGIRYIEEETVKEFTKCQFCPENRRGIGFDKIETDAKKISPTTKLASNKSFGHSGFTGTMVWADPETGIIFIFLSNRVYPIAENNKIVKLGVRTSIHKAIYNSVINTTAEKDTVNLVN